MRIPVVPAHSRPTLTSPGPWSAALRRLSLSVIVSVLPRRIAVAHGKRPTTVDRGRVRYRGCLTAHEHHPHTRHAMRDEALSPQGPLLSNAGAPADRRCGIKHA